MAVTQKRSYRETKDYYELLREDARQIAHKQLPASLLNKRKSLILKNDISFGGFTTNCQKELRRWELHPSRRVAWEWDAVQKKYRTHPKRFELAIWHRKLFLAGATIGRPTWSNGKLRLDFIESSPMGTPIDGLITEMSIAAGVAYAGLIGASQLRITDPVNDKVRDHYLSKAGFAYSQQGNFCYRDL